MKEETYKRIDIPFDAENIEMDGYSLNIPEGFEAVIENNKVVIKRKINKIKETITYILANTDLSKVSTPFSDMLKWLETAKDNFNFINKIQIGDKVTRNKDGMLVNLSQLDRVAKKDEKRGEQKPAECRQETKPNGGIVSEDFNEGDGYYKVNLAYLSKLQVELIENLVASWQNSVNNIAAWSEEDEKIFDRICDLIHSAAYANYDVDEDDNECGEYAKIIGWFKSLKERYTWKPSGGQMKQLEWIAKQNKDNMIGKELMTLYQDLKKLKA